MDHKTFCVNPWVSLHYNMGKKFNPCCLFNGAVSVNSISDYANSTELANIKQDLLNGKQIPNCRDCWNQESRGYTSKRQRDNESYQKIFQLKYKKDLYAPSDKFVEYYVRLGNHCNLRCTTCNDSLSSGWISENKKFGLPYGEVRILEADNEIWQHLRDNARDIGVIEFIGGEPFMMSTTEQQMLFEYFVETNHARHIRLKYNTNGTRLPTEQLASWPAFNKIEINISVDGIGPRFEYLRNPAVWEEVEQNIAYYQSLQATVPGLTVTLIHTLSILNIGYVDEIIDYCKEHNLNLFLNMLEYPDYFSLYNAPVKPWILERIKDIDHPVINSIRNTIDKTYVPTDIAWLLDHCRTIGQRRNINFDLVFPELVLALESNV